MSERKNTGRHDAGFTLVELMAVVAIVSILAVVALSAYSDYAIRAKVAEGLAMAAEAKTSISEYYYSNGFQMPTNNSQAGLPPADSYDNFTHVSRLEIRSTDPRPGTIEVTFKISGLGGENLLQLVPATINELVSWTCVPPDTNGITTNRLPPTCRGN